MSGIKLSNDPVVTVAEAPSASSKRWINKEYKLSELFSRFQHRLRSGETQAQFLALKNSKDKADRDKAKQIKDRAGGFVGGKLDGTGRRQSENVISRRLLTWDIDSGVKPFLLPGICCCNYSTHSHTKDHPRFRVIGLLSREVTAQEYETLSRLYALEVAEWLGLEPDQIFTDDSTHSPEHLQYWPSAPSDAEIVFDWQDGQPIDVDRVLDTNREPYYPKKRPVSPTEPRKEGEKVPIGQRYQHLISRLGMLIARNARNVSDEAILSMLWTIAHEECAGDIDGEDFREFCKVYRPAAEAFRAALSGDYDYSEAVKVYFQLHPGEELPQRGNAVDWERIRNEVEAARITGEAEKAAERAEEAFNQMEADYLDTDNSHDGEPQERPKKSKNGAQYEPLDYTDVGQARALYQVYGGKLRYSRATKWLVYDGKRWEESEERARSIIHKFTDLQLKEARKMLKEARAKLDAAVEAQDDEAKKAAQEEVKKASGYRSHILNYRKAFRISATLTELAPSVLIEVKELDKNPYLLNTPSGTVDLKTGEIHPHNPEDYCTKITACGPSAKGAEEWARFLEQLTSGDDELKEYLQMCFGMASIGAALDEKLLIAYGSGGNGKSTCCNAVYTVLGDYSGNLSAEALTVQKMKNIDPELAELRGKRLILAAELQEGQRLNTSVVKKICSTDLIQAAKKFKDYFSFRPSHTVILFTNHLPKIGSNDRGTLDRLVVLPFKGRFRDTQEEIKNYGQVLADRCGGAILSWVIQGARKYIEARCRLPEAKAVQEATAEYTQSANWLAPFLEEMCETDIHYSQTSGPLYQAYRRYCEQTGEGYIRSAADFRAEMEKADFYWRKTKHGAMYHGVRLIQEESWRDARRN